MQLNSYLFILFFLPLSVGIYFLANRWGLLWGKIALIAGCFVFYAWGGQSTLWVLGLSLAVNYLCALLQVRHPKKWVLALPLVLNIGLLAFYKYWNPIWGAVGPRFGTDFTLQHLILPLGISFFTFQQIAYQVSLYRGELEGPVLTDYLCYILYFPKLAMGPLMEPVDFMQQLNDPSRKKISSLHIAQGLRMFSFGLFKKMLLADVFAGAVNWVFANEATSMDYLIGMLCYTLEIYFDFSGYSDMAVGISHMLNITLPINFDSPYQSLNIREFWKRWHISLTKFFTKYLYIPLGGSRKGLVRTCLLTVFVFLVSGLWHGTGLTFLLWGLLNGLLMVFDRLTEKRQQRLFGPFRWLMTFGAINILWLLFRAGSIHEWVSALFTLFSMQSTEIGPGLIQCFELKELNLLASKLPLGFLFSNFRGVFFNLYMVFGLVLCLGCRNNYRRMDKKLTFPDLVLTVIAFTWSLICLGGETTFVYAWF